MAISLGSINFGLAPDTSRLQSAMRDVVNFGNAIDSMAASVGGASNQVVDAMSRQEKAMTAALARIQQYNDQVRRAGAPDQLIQHSTLAFKDLTSELSRGQLSSLEYQRAMERFSASMTLSQRGLREWKQANQEANTHGDHFKNTLHSIEKASQLAEGPLSGVASRVLILGNLFEHVSVGGVVFTAGLALGSFAMTKLGESTLETIEKLEKVEARLKFVTGSQMGFTNSLEFARKVANETGSEFLNLADKYSRMQQAAKGTYLEGQRTNEIFQTIVESSRKFDASTDQVNQTLDTFTQMIGRGRVEITTLKRRLETEMPGAFKAAADAAGKTTMQFEHMLREGRMLSSDDFLPKFIAQLRKLYDLDHGAHFEGIESSRNRLSNAFTKFNEQLNEIIGTSNAYINATAKISQGIKFLGDNITGILSLIGAFAAGLTAWYAPAIIIGIGTALPGAIMAVTRAIIALVAASATIGGFISALTRTVLAIGGAVIGFKAMNEALDSHRTSMNGTTPAVEAFIESQVKARTATRATTEEFIKQQAALNVLSQASLARSQEELAGLTREMDNSTQTMRVWNNETKRWTDRSILDPGGEMGKKPDQLVKELQGRIDTVKAKIAELDVVGQKGVDTMQKLQNILDGKSPEGAAGKRTDDQETGRERRQRIAMKDAQKSIADLRSEFGAMIEGPQSLRKWKEELDITKPVEQFRDKLDHAGFSTSVVTQKTAQYEAALRKMKAQMKWEAEHTSFFEFLQTGFQKLGDTAISKFTDDLVNAQLSMKTLADIGKSVVSDLIKEFMKLAILAPIKNALFGTNAPVFSLSGPGSGIVGGWLKNMGLGMNPANVTAGVSGSASAGASAIAMGAAMGKVFNGPHPIHFDHGGILDHPTRFSFAGGTAVAGEVDHEAIMPLKRLPSGALGVAATGAGGTQIHIHEAPGVKADVQSSAAPGGGEMIEVRMKRMMRSVMMEDALSDGPHSRATAKRYGLNRTVGMT
jgi:tape measure domain-containing protein